LSYLRAPVIKTYAFANKTGTVRLYGLDVRRRVTSMIQIFFGLGKEG
jgi:hypothetical protein